MPVKYGAHGRQAPLDAYYSWHVVVCVCGSLLDRCRHEKHILSLFDDVQAQTREQECAIRGDEDIANVAIDEEDVDPQDQGSLVALAYQIYCTSLLRRGLMWDNGKWKAYSQSQHNAEVRRTPVPPWFVGNLLC